MNSGPVNKPRAAAIATADWRVIFNRKPLLFTCGGMLLVGLLWGVWFYLMHPPRPWIVRWQISRYLKKHATPSVFKVDFAFPSKAEMAAAPKSSGKPELQKGSRTGKDFDTLAQQYIELKTSALIMEREIPESQAEISVGRPRLEELSKNLVEAKAAGTTNISVLEAQIKGLQQRLAAFEKKAAAGPELQKKEQALEPMLADLLDFQQIWEQEAKTVEVASANRFAKASDEFMAANRTKIGTAETYAAMYHVIGQQLFVADRLLGSANPDHRRTGVSMAIEASRQALDSAINGGLAARICEGYILPNLDLANDVNRRSQFNLDNVLNHCVDVFRRNDEQHNVVRTYELLLAKANTPQRADAARSQLARVHENAGDFKEALYYLKQIKLTNDYRWMVQRIPRLEKQLQNK